MRDAEMWSLETRARLWTLTTLTRFYVQLAFRRRHWRLRRNVRPQSIPVTAHWRLLYQPLWVMFSML